ncbi:zinc ABC transporter substrate-binding protein [Algihabitans albus]|uniref:zinc ABC transporter substrate-binding protein n=1 Tax=Algihabitans albus TaxID=2164067 RepID=UPI000E5D4BB1|nr:zinc ABC transporter substrate-binding protein [Algihabitans albus]
MVQSLRAGLLSAAVLLLSAPAVADDQLQVAVSIKPIHSLVSAVTRGASEPHLIVKGGGSPHTYSLRPSNAEALEQADAVFWVGPDLETFLIGPIGQLAPQARKVSFQEVEGLVRLPVRDGGGFEPHSHDHAEGHSHDHAEGHSHDHDHDHDHDGKEPQADRPGAFNAHYWLDPANAQLFVSHVATVLGEIDPDHADTYRRNATETLERLASLTDEMEAVLAPVAGEPFVVFHDAYQYLENRFGLNAVGSITLSPDRSPGAGRIAEIRDKIAELGAACIFAEPQFESRLVGILVEETQARAGILDPLGADLPDGPDLYFELMRRNADALRACLQQSS